MAHLNINLKSIRYNIDIILSTCSGIGIDVVGVVKPCQDFDPIVDLYNNTPLSYLGVSKVYAAKRLSRLVQKPLMLTCVPRPDIVDDVVKYCDLSLNSELGTIVRLAEATERNRCSHGVLLMVEVGDLREGVLPTDVVPIVAKILALKDKGIRFAGIGANYGCVNGVLPNFDNIGLMDALAKQLKENFGVAPEIVSLGGSVVLDWLEKHGLPSSVNQIRIGEPLLLGTLSGVNRIYKTLHRDALEFEAAIVEVKCKPSFPAGEKAGDAFGIKHEREDQGIRTRAILDFGVVDTDPTSLITTVPGLCMITSNSDYTVVDVTECDHPFNVGDSIKFRLTYKSMLQCFTSGQLQKNVRGCRDGVDACLGCTGRMSRCSSSQLNLELMDEGRDQAH